MVRCAPKPSLREPSCCKVLVINGGYGFWVNGFSSALATVSVLLVSLLARSLACASLSVTTAAGLSSGPSFSLPVAASKSRPWASRTPFSSLRRAGKLA